MSNQQAVIFDIEHGSYVDGPGLRTVVFFKGCNLACKWCHNPESQSALPEKMYYQDLCTHCGKCKTVCPTPENCTLCGKCALYCPNNALRICGKAYSLSQVIGEIEGDAPFLKHAGGVTFSGGECMLQTDFLKHLLSGSKALGLHTAVDTAGNVPWERFEAILEDTDLFLYDIKCMDSQRHKEGTGVSNELILDNLHKLLALKKDIWVRIPIIPGYNDTVEEMEKVRDFFENNGFPNKIELLPYHSMGENKYRALSRDIAKYMIPDVLLMEKLNKVFEC